jgi:DNA-directed RNA polymerase specialized sigma24 family protein
MTDRSDDRALLARIRAGDKAACAQCIEQHSPEVYRLAIRLMRELEELSTQAAAEALGVSEEVVKTRLRRGRMWLRERLAGYFSLKATPMEDLNYD